MVNQAMVVTAICVQFLISGYGIGFSAPSLGQVLILMIDMMTVIMLMMMRLVKMMMMMMRSYQVKKEELLTPTELEYFASSLVVGQVIVKYLM